ncbi:hypothetical protein NQZ79_g5778 [Umbelopsis isabellina]|nr:hypothetical protein NQZ79_g5778 [Umbelopsis isabellina]
MSKRPVDIAQLKNLQRKRRALQSREAEQDKKNAFRQTKIDFFARPSVAVKPKEQTSQSSVEEDNPFRLSSQTSAQAHNPFTCSSQPEFSSQSSFSLLENLSQPDPYASSSEDEDEQETDVGIQDQLRLDMQVASDMQTPPDLKRNASLVIKQKGDESGLDGSKQPLVINLSSQGDFKTFLEDDMSDATESVNSDAEYDRAEHDDYDISDEVFRFSRATISDSTASEILNPNNEIPESHLVDVSTSETSKLLSILKAKSENDLHKISGNVDIPNMIKRQSSAKTVTDTRPTQPDAPFDWALKTRVLVTSTHDFNWIKFDAQHRARALARVRSASFADEALLSYCNMDTDADYNVTQCLHHWAYPNAPPTAQKISATNRLLSKTVYTEADELELEEWHANETEWEESLRSLFELLLIGECDYFYFIGVTVCILFRASKFSETNRLEAVSSRCTAAFWRQLDEAGVKYDMPYQAVEKENEIIPQGVLDDLEYLESINPGSTRTGKQSGNIDYAQSTFFRVQGERNMETLIDALVQWKEPRTSDRAHGPPHLISPQCFLNSTLKRASLVRRTARRVTKDSTGTTNEDVLYKLDIHGYIVPTNQFLLYNILSKNIPGEHSYWIEGSSQNLSKGLNKTSEKDVDGWAKITSKHSLASIDQVEYTRNAYRIG